MTQPRLHVARNALPAVSSTLWALMRDEPLPQPHNRWEEFTGVTREVWTLYRDGILAEWIASHPGRRPSSWWRFDAPRWSPEMPGCEDWPASLDLCAPRLRAGGRGTASHDALADSPSLELGIPTSWMRAAAVDYYFHEGDFIGDAFDVNDPPTFESEAAYLRRLKLFAPGEARRVKASQFKPETVTWRPHNEDD